MESLIRRYVRISILYHKLILLLAALLIGVSAWISSGLTVDSNLESMFPDNHPLILGFRAMDEEFGGQDKVLIAVQGTGGTAEAYVEELAAELNARDLVSKLLYRIDPSFIEQNGLLYLPSGIFERLEVELADPSSALSQWVDSPGLSTAQNLLQDRLPQFPPTQRTELINAFASLGTPGATQPEYSRLLGRMIFGYMEDAGNAGGNRSESGYLVARTGDLYLMILKPSIPLTDQIQRESFFVGVQEAIADVKASSPAFAAIEAGYTGGQIVQDYEGDRAAFDGFFSTAFLTFAILMLIIILSFRRLGVPLASGLPLILGTLLTSAMAVLVYGSINLFSISFAVLLLGLGIDFAIHLLARYSEERANGQALEEALVNTLERTGTGIVAGAVTTSAAFGAFYFAEFGALRQMGVISSSGILLALVSMLGLMPAIIAWADRHPNRMAAKNVEFGFLGPVGQSIVRFRWTVLALILLGLAFSWKNVVETRIDSDFTAIYPSNLPSERWLKLVQEGFDFTPDTLSLIARDLDQVQEWTQKLQALPSVAKVESILDFLPADQERKLAVLRRLQERQTAGVHRMMESGPAGSPAALSPESLAALASGRNIRPVSIADLPEVLAATYVGQSGRFLLEVSPKGYIWDVAVRDAFEAEIYAALGAQPIGLPYLVRELIEMVANDVLRVTLIAGAVIFLVLLAAFRSALHALLALTPVAAGIFLTFGLRPLLNFEFNMFNIMAMPLLIGIGVDNGIHIIHRVRQEGIAKLPAVMVHTGKAVTLTTLTSMIGFGSLSLTNHPGLVSIGKVVVLGLSLALIMVVTLLPALLSVTHQPRSQVHPEHPKAG